MNSSQAYLLQFLSQKQNAAPVTCSVCTKAIPKLELDKHIRRDHLNYRPFACGECVDAGVSTHFYTRDDASLHARRYHKSDNPRLIEDLVSVKEALFETTINDSLATLGQGSASPAITLPTSPGSPMPPPTTPRLVPTPSPSPSPTPRPRTGSSRFPALYDTPEPRPLRPQRCRIPGVGTSPTYPGPSVSASNASTNNTSIPVNTPIPSGPRPIYSGLDTSVPLNEADDSGYLSTSTPEPSREARKYQNRKLLVTCTLCSEQKHNKTERRQHSIHHAMSSNPDFDSADEVQLLEAHNNCFPHAKRDFPEEDGRTEERTSTSERKRKSTTGPVPRAAIKCAECGKTSSYDHRLDHVVRHHWDQYALACRICNFRVKWSVAHIKDHISKVHGQENAGEYEDERETYRAQIQAKVRALFSNPDSTIPTPAPDEEQEEEEEEEEDEEKEQHHDTPEPPEKSSADQCHICGEPVQATDMSRHVWEHLLRDGQARFICAPCNWTGESGRGAEAHRRYQSDIPHDLVDRTPTLIPAFSHTAKSAFPNYQLADQTNPNSSATALS